MRIVEPTFQLMWMTANPLEMIERIGRICYKSEDRIMPGTAVPFVQMLLKRGHLAMIEHASMSYWIRTDRGVTHELVRHRLFSFAQESTRYCNYGNVEVQFIKPPVQTINAFESWRNAMKISELRYHRLITDGEKPEIARSVLPNSLKAEIVATGNFREWLHFFTLRTTPQAHPQMRQIANMILDDVLQRVPVIFDQVRG